VIKLAGKNQLVNLETLVFPWFAMMEVYAFAVLKEYP
jgi:hypothetical protein